MIKRYITNFLLFFTVFILFGCLKELNYVKSDLFTDNKISQIKEGQTTKEDILKIFGKPESDLVLEEYDSFFFKDYNLKSLLVKFDKSGKVIEFKLSK